MTTVADECPEGGNHAEGAPQESGNTRFTNCSKCGTRMSTGMIPQPGDPDSER